MIRIVFVLFACFFFSIQTRAALSVPTLNEPANGDTAVGHTPQLKLQPQFQNYIFEFEIADNASFSNSTFYASNNYYYYVNSALAFSTTYYWRARVKTATDSSAWTSAWSFKTSGKVELLYPGATSNNWASGQYFSCHRTVDSAYIFEFDTVSTFNSGEKFAVSIPDSGTAFYTEVQNLNLLFGKTYYWRARSYTGTDSSAWSETRSGYTRDSVTLSLPNPIYVHPTTVQLKYSGGGAVYYITEIDTSTGFNTVELQRDTVYGTFGTTVQYLKYNTTYYWRVKMFNTRDTSRWSQVWNFKTVKYDNTNMTVYRDPDPEIIVRKPELDFVEYYAFEYDTVNTFNSPFLVQRESTGEDTLRNLLFGKTYYLRYRAMHQKDTSGWTRIRAVNISRFPTPYRPFHNATDVKVHDSLTWDFFVYGVSGFQIQCDTSSDFSSAIALDTVIDMATAMNLRGIINGNNWLFNQKYYWRIRMWHDEDTSDWSDVNIQRSFTTIAKPTLVKPYNGPLLPPGTDPLFTWDPIPGVPYYRLQLDTNENLNSANRIDTLIPESALGTWYKRYLLFGTRYYWRVKAIDTYDSSEWSDTWSFDVRDKVRLYWPKNNAVNYSPGLTLDWRSQSGTEGYILWVSEDSTFQTYVEVTDTVSNPFFAYPDASIYKFSTPYFWKVKVFHALDTGEWSEIWKFTVRDRVAPTLISPANGATNVPVTERLKWNSYSGAASYRYQLATDSLFTQLIHNQAIVGTGSNSLSLQPSTTYYWHVIGRNLDGKEFGEYSETWSFTTDSGLKAPTLLSPANGATLNVLSPKFTWIGDGGVYQFELAESPLMANPLVYSTSNETYTATSLKYGRNYWWRVRSVVGPVLGPWSEIWTFGLQDPNNVEELQKQSVIFPNPSSGAFTLQTQNKPIDLKMFNALGQEVIIEVHQTGENLEVNYRICSPGIYWVVWMDEHGIHQQKIQVENPSR